MEKARREHELIVSISPHVKSDETVSRIMWTVNLSLLPAFVMGVYFFGYRAVYVTALCIIGSLFSEWLVQKMTDREITVTDGSSFPVDCNNLLRDFHVIELSPYPWK